MSEYDAMATSGVAEPTLAVASFSAAKTSASFNPLSSARVYDAWMTWAVGDGIGEREADLDEVRAAPGDGRQKLASEVDVGVAGGDERHEGLAARATQTPEEIIDRVHEVGCIGRRGACPARQ
jgi:hypothetical protein